MALRPPGAARDVVLAHPLRLKAIWSGRAKTDKIDAKVLGNVRYLRAASLHSLGIRGADAAPRARAAAAGAPAVRVLLGRAVSGLGAGPAYTRARGRPRGFSAGTRGGRPLEGASA